MLGLLIMLGIAARNSVSISSTLMSTMRGLALQTLRHNGQSFVNMSARVDETLGFRQRLLTDKTAGQGRFLGVSSTNSFVNMKDPQTPPSSRPAPLHDC